MTAHTLIHPAHAEAAGDDTIMAIDPAARQMLRHLGRCVEIAGRGQPSADRSRRAA